MTTRTFGLNSREFTEVVCGRRERGVDSEWGAGKGAAVGEDARWGVGGC
jgi:hypothetical protein